MSSYRVLITDYAWPDLNIERSVLSQIDAEIILPTSTGEPDLISAAEGVDAIMTNWASTTERVIAAAKGCRIVARMGIGLDNIDVSYCTAHRIPVTNVPDYCLIEVAEHTLALLLSIARNVAHYHWRTKSGEYRLQDGVPLRRIEGQTLGIVGLGQIGALVAKKARGLGLNVLATGRTEKVIPGITWCDFETLLRESDYVTLHCPLTPETRHLMNQEAFGHMKPTAFLINTARGGVVDHAALAQALNENRLAGAALDVQVPEPPCLDDPPYNDPRVIVTPHAAFVSQESLQDLRQRAANQVADRLRDKVPENVVNPAVLV